MSKTKNVPTATERETGYGYTEFTFESEIDLNDSNLMWRIARALGHTVADQDWRDPYTLWVWDNESEGGEGE